MIKKFKDYFRKNAPDFVLWTHKVRGILAFYIFGMPSKRLKVIGVTGTNGKTTTSHLIARILEESGKRVALASTIILKFGSKEESNKTRLTTMSPFFLQSFLRKALKEGCEYVVVETTSHSIMQYRDWGIRYEGVCMTNVTHEHLDYHKTFDQYVEVKTRLFQRLPKVAVANMDDPNYEKFLRFTAQKHITYSQKKKANITARKILPSTDGTIFTLATPTYQEIIDLKLPAAFNVSNALCASAVCYGLGISAGMIKKGLESVTSIPGRLEKVERGQDFVVIIDYAVTPDSLEKLYSTLKDALRGKMIAVLGACGDRDKIKRPIMGSIAGHYNDYVIVTDEEPYSEDPLEIIEQVASGVERGKKDQKMVLGEDYFKIDNRREGISKALSLAQKGDLVIITGMGSQEIRVVGSKKEPWNERKLIEEELGKLGYNKK